MRLMHISYGEATDTPLRVIRQQLTYNDIEVQIKQMKANEQNA